MKVALLDSKDCPVWFNFRLFEESRIADLAAFLCVPDSLIEFLAVQCDAYCHNNGKGYVRSPLSLLEYLKVVEDNKHYKIKEREFNDVTYYTIVKSNEPVGISNEAQLLMGFEEYLAYRFKKRNHIDIAMPKHYGYVMNKWECDGKPKYDKELCEKISSTFDSNKWTGYTFTRHRVQERRNDLCSFFRIPHGQKKPKCPKSRYLRSYSILSQNNFGHDFLYALGGHEITEVEIQNLGVCISIFNRFTPPTKYELLIVKTATEAFMRCWRALGITLSPKAHFVDSHLYNHLVKYGAHGIYSEESIECLHARYNRYTRLYSNIRDKIH